MITEILYRFGKFFATDDLIRIGLGVQAFCAWRIFRFTKKRMRKFRTQCAETFNDNETLFHPHLDILFSQN